MFGIPLILLPACYPNVQSITKEDEISLGQGLQKNECCFPEELMYEGNPIHPTCMCGIGFGDSSRLKPHSIEYVHNKSVCDREINHELVYDEKMNKVFFRLNYSASEEGSEYTLYDAYQYIGSYKRKHILIMESYDTSGHGSEVCLALVKRVGNTIVNVGEITGGDRGSGGMIEIIAHHNNVLRYRQCASIDTIMRTLKKEDCGTHFSYMVSGLSLVYEIDLDSDINPGAYDYPSLTIPSQVVGLMFDEQDYASDSRSHRDNEDLHDRIERAIGIVADSYVKQGKKELTLMQAQMFADEVMENVQKV